MVLINEKQSYSVDLEEEPSKLQSVSQACMGEHITELKRLAHI